MPMNRRQLLLSAAGAAALSLSRSAEAATSKTTIVFVNNLGAGRVVKIAATTPKLSFDHTIQPGHSVTQHYSTDNKVGTWVAIGGTIAVVGLFTAQPIDDVEPGLRVTYGKTNTFTISKKNGNLHLGRVVS